MSSKELCLSILEKANVPINSSDPWSIHVRNEKLWDRIPQYDLRFKRMWNYYLLASAAGFRSRNLNLNQYVFRKNGVSEQYIPVR